MAVFEYKALSASGREIKGVVDADGVRSARQRLKQQGIYPISLVESVVSQQRKSWNFAVDFSSRRVSTAHLSVATRQLATLVAAGMPLVESLRALSEQVDHASLRKIIADIGDQVNEGSTLANALRSYPEVFPRLYSNMVASGEASGSLDLVLERLADLLENQAALRRRVLSALTYPMLMLLLCFGVVTILLAYVVPQITAIFAERGATLPLATRIVISLSDTVRSFWWAILVVLALALILFGHYRRTAAGRLRIDALKLRLPLVGPLTLKMATSRFARNLGTMLASGIELLTALSIARNIVGNVILEESVDSAISGVREGSSLAFELGKSKRFPVLLIRMIAIGEKTGALEPLLLRAAASYESEVNSVVSALTSILEPLLILVLAGVVGLILASVMLPMLEMSSLAGL